MSADLAGSTSPTAAPEVDFPTFLEKVIGGSDLTAGEAEAAFGRFMDGSAGAAAMAGLLIALRCKGIAPSEVAGGVRALRSAMVPVTSEDPDVLVDTCGTGGGTVTTFNISTAAALVAAGAGVRVAKHGNRSFTSRSGSADVLEALGVRIDLAPERMAEILAEAGVVFMFAPLLHPAMRHVGPVRRELGVTTVMNVLGPLTNPAGARRQVVGVADPALLGLISRALQELGHARALVVHGAPGMDELSPTGPTRVAELRAGSVTEWQVSPEALGLEPHPLEDLAGGSPEENAALILSVLEGRVRHGARTAMLLNAGAAIYVADRVASLEEGVRVAGESLDSGAARETLERLKEASGR
ncbi:MAG: anthranilate phosphoribosyltransferase [Gemmatimonadetes bacterium]|nr:anthranilate phosphoribosyltransferase [Gemmatimonadota bacterium]